MGLIKALLGAADGVLADQWREYFYCDSLPNNILVRKGKKRISDKRSSNTKAEDNIITNGSIIAVNEGQCMLIVEQGKVVDVCAEPGEYTYDASTEPSIFYGGLGKGIKDSFITLGKRFTFGGDTAKDQRVYYINTKEILDNRFGTSSPIPFRIVDKNIGLDIDTAIKCHGVYSYILKDPVIFYTKICSNVVEEYNKNEIDNQLKTELISSLQPALAKISEMGIRYSAVPAHTEELSEILKQELTKKWFEDRGIELRKCAMGPMTLPEEDEKMIKELQRNATLRDPNMAGAHMVGATAEAMKMAAQNEGGMGAMGAFMGMGMAQNAGGSASSLFAMGQQNRQQMPQQQAPQQQVAGWICGCGTGGNTGKFCMNCGKPQPTQEGWTCSCGAINKGKFCQNCGKQKPAGEPLYKCDKCGWEPADPKNPPKFCPECGDLFDDNDIK